MGQDINPGVSGSNPQYLTVYNNRLFFQADDGAHGAELWSTDGSASGAQLVSDIFSGISGSYPQGFTLYSGKLFFQATDSLHGSELWASDGTNVGTVLIKDLNPGSYSSAPASFIAYHGKLYFIAAFDSVSGAQLCVTDGTSNGTYAILPGDSLATNPLGATMGFTLYNNSLAFNAFYDGAGEELWFFNDLPTAVNNIDGNSTLALYPNPCRDYYALTGFTAGNKYIVKLTDLSGKILQSIEIQPNASEVTFNMPQIVPGMYLLQVAGNGETKTLTLVKGE